MGQKTNPNIYRLGVNKQWKTEFFEKKRNEFAFFSYLDLEIQYYIERFLNIHGILLQDYKVYYNNAVINIYISYCIPSTFKLKKNLKIRNKQKTKQITYSLNEYKKFQKIIQQNFLDLKPNLNSKIKNPFIRYKNHFKSKNGSFISINQLQGLNLNTLSLNNFIKKFIYGLIALKNNQNNIIINLHCLNNKINLTYKQKQSLKKKILLLQRFKNTDIFKESITVLFLTVYKANSAKLLSELIKHQLQKTKRHKALINFFKKTLTLFLNSNFSQLAGIKIIIKGRLNGVPRARHKIINIGDTPTQTINSKINYAESVMHNLNGSYGIKVWVIEK